ncbi:hypothetical protein D3C72_1050610 [compost metagenome]
MRRIHFVARGQQLWRDGRKSGHVPVIRSNRPDGTIDARHRGGSQRVFHPADLIEQLLALHIALGLAQLLQQAQIGELAAHIGIAVGHGTDPDHGHVVARPVGLGLKAGIDELPGQQGGTRCQHLVHAGIKAGGIAIEDGLVVW